MSVNIYQPTWRHVREESILHVLFIFWGSGQRFPNFNLMEHQHSASRTTMFHHWNQEMVVFQKFALKILIVRILSWLYFSCNILHLSHPSSHVHNNSLFSESHVHQNKFSSCPITAQKYLHVSRTERLGLPTVQSNGSGYTEHASRRVHG